MRMRCRSFFRRYQMLVLTSPTGQIGRQVLDRVLDHREPIRVIARDPGRLPTRVRERVDVVQGSHGDPDVIDRAFAGADAVFWLVPPDPHAASLEVAVPGLHPTGLRLLQNQQVERVDRGDLSAGPRSRRSAGCVSAWLAMEPISLPAPG